jgi:hypothetical protein
LFVILLGQMPVEISAEQKTQAEGQPIKINILTEQSMTECKPSDKDEIVVCAEKMNQEQYRLRPILNADKYKKDPVKAEFALSVKVTILSEGEAASLPQGAQSNRIMVRARIKF